MATTTMLWTVRTQLVSIFTTALAAQPSVEIFDGPRPRKAEPKSFLLIGSDGGETGTGEGGSEDGATVQEVPSKLGPGTWRDEVGEIVCSAWTWSGDAALAPLRVIAAGIVVPCETALRDRTLGGVLVPPGLAAFGEARFREAQTPNGAVVRCVFTINYRALLT